MSNLGGLVCWSQIGFLTGVFLIEVIVVLWMDLLLFGWLLLI